MTDEELAGLARQALNMAITERKNTGRGRLVLAVYFEGEGIHRMRKIEKEIDRRLGEEWLNDERKKDYGFAVIRKAIDLSPPHAIVMVTPTNMFLPTAKFQAMSLEEQKRIMDAGNRDHHRMAAQGYLRIVDSMSASVQTPERVCFCVQEVDDHGNLVGQPDVKFFRQEDVSGRLKMFGEDKIEAQRQKRRAN